MVRMSVYAKTVVLSRSIIIPAGTVAVPCVRLFRRKCGWMLAERMCLMPLISIWCLQSLIFWTLSFTVTRNCYMTRCIMRLPLPFRNWHPTQSTSGLLLVISASCIHGAQKWIFIPISIWYCLAAAWHRKMSGKTMVRSFFYPYGLSPESFVGNIWMSWKISGIQISLSFMEQQKNTVIIMLSKSW